MVLEFGLIGDGHIAQKHRNAIKKVGGAIRFVYDPKYTKADGFRFLSLSKRSEWIEFCRPLDYVVICSPTYLHREHLINVLKYAPNRTQVIVEKPMCLPWEPVIDDDRINVCLQLNWFPVPDFGKPKKIFVRMVRDEEYFKSWKGDPKLTGGIFYNLFIHYIVLAQKLKIPFVGIVSRHGKQIRTIEYHINNGTFVDIDINAVDMDILYSCMYYDILLGKGVKPKDLFYIHWLLERNSYLFGFGESVLNKEIIIDYDLY